ncbi:hypothetical protein [Lacihabitans soyangensis]|uniref:Uncharacterized protein n=1 Tax=Lacihabitans soyangensis TaxID=869394 RepID=A0AAE3H6Q8_9BACT|nr:hypothetical protein [Lacihabitans soyangensis]MCP9765943.1 hypothetical protein [Lacihabitans soyangensis]
MSVILCCCQSHDNTLELYGKWVDLSCVNVPKKCTSRFPIIHLDAQRRDSIFVQKQDGRWEGKWTNHKWESFSLKLENGYESLLYPNYKTKTLQYYDNTTKQFVYYTKLPSP